MSFQSLLNQTLTVNKADGGTTRFGVKKEGTQVTMRARIERVRRVILDEAGRESTIMAEIFTDPGANIAREDIALVDGEKMLVLSVEPAVHGNGITHHLEVKAGRRGA